MNNNFEIVLNNNKEFINSISNIMSKIYSECSISEDIKKIEDDFISFLIEKDLSHLFRYLLLVKDGIRKENNTSDALNLKDNYGIFWVFSINKEKVELESVSTTFMNNMIALEHDKDVSTIFSQTSKLKLYIELTDNVNTKEIVELNSLNYDINIESIFNYNINNFIFLDSKEFISKNKSNQNKYKLNT